MILIFAIAVTITMPILQEQIAIRQIESIARRFIAHAHFARQQALYLGEPIMLEPKVSGNWEGGWLITSGCLGKGNQPACSKKVWLSHSRIDPVVLKGGGRNWIDPHAGKAGLLFNAAGAAKTSQGGFVANRLILGHKRVPGLERQLILGSGGRWRICDPTKDPKRCH